MCHVDQLTHQLDEQNSLRYISLLTVIKKKNLSYFQNFVCNEMKLFSPTIKVILIYINQGCTKIFKLLSITYSLHC